MGSGTIGVAVSKDGTPDSGVGSCSARRHPHVASKLAHHQGELGKSVKRGVVPRFQVTTFTLTSGRVQGLCRQQQFLGI